MQEKLQKIHEATMQILENTGMKFHHPEAVEILKAHGIRMEGNVAHFTEEQLMYWVRKAPSSFTLYARNPKHNVVIGGDNVVTAPGYGCPTITLKDGTKRDGTILDYVNFAKMYHANPDFDTDGGLMIQPNDIDIPSSVLAMFYAVLTHSDKALLVSTGKRPYMEAMMKALCEVFGGEEALKAYPRVLTIMNINSPLQLDITMTDVLITFAKYGQPFVAANCAMAGSTSPATLAGTMAVTNAEILSCIALTQMINPGTPVVYASQTTTADMRSGQIAAGAPEGALCYKYTANLAKFYGLPCRGGGAVTDAKVVDTQSGYESMITLMADYSNKMNLIIHAAGILEGYVSTSYEKVIQDFEIIRYVKRFFRDIEVTDESIPLELIAEVGHDGEYLTKEHTFRYCRTESIAPTISVRGNVSDPVNAVMNNIEKQYEKLMESYVQPEFDKPTFDKVKAILVDAGVSASLLDKIETM